MNNCTRLLYFDSEDARIASLAVLLRAQGYESELDQFKIVREVGYGSTSRVMLARHRSTNEQFALKIIDTSTGYLASRKDQEVAVHTRCKNCPNVVRFKD